MNHNICVYRNQPVPISETFVYNQVFALRRYTAYVLGANWPKGPGIPLPSDRARVINEGGIGGWLREFRWKVLGEVPKEVLAWAQGLRPMLVHAHFGPDGAVAMPLARKLSVPLVVSFHGTDATMRPVYVWRNSYMTHRLYWLRRRELARVASRVIVQSDFLGKLVLERHAFAEEKVVCIRHGVDLEEFRPLGGRTEWGHVLYVGRLIELKGLRFLLQALAELVAWFPRLHLTVIGDGPMRVQYESQGRELLGERVAFLDAQPQKVVREHLQRAYVFCMPSVTMPSGEAETLGMVFLEAMAMKVPVVSFQSGGIPEVILHGKTGFLAEECDVRKLAQHLRVLLENPALRDRMGEEGRKWVEQEFNLERQNAKLESVYDEVIEEHVRVSRRRE